MSQQLDELIKSLSDLKRQKKELDAGVSVVEKKIAQVEIDIRDIMDVEHLVEAATAVGSVKVGDSVYPQVKDWDAFYDFIYQNKYFHLLEKRPAVLAYRELLNIGREVPGTLPFTKRKVTFKES